MKIQPCHYCDFRACTFFGQVRKPEAGDVVAHMARTGIHKTQTAAYWLPILCNENVADGEVDC